eukprot:TCONS_00038591-protein
MSNSTKRGPPSPLDDVSHNIEDLKADFNSQKKQKVHFGISRIIKPRSRSNSQSSTTSNSENSDLSSSSKLKSLENNRSSSKLKSSENNPSSSKLNPSIIKPQETHSDEVMLETGFETKRTPRNPFIQETPKKKKI